MFIASFIRVLILYVRAAVTTCVNKTEIRYHGIELWHFRLDSTPAPMPDQRSALALNSDEAVDTCLRTYIHASAEIAFQCCYAYPFSTTVSD